MARGKKERKLRLLLRLLLRRNERLTIQKLSKKMLQKLQQKQNLQKMRKWVCIHFSVYQKG